MIKVWMAKLFCASILAILTGCAQSTAPGTPVERKTEVKVDVDEDGDKRVTKETTVRMNSDGTKTETTRKVEEKTEVHDGKIIDLPGVEVRKKD